MPNECLSTIRCQRDIDGADRFLLRSACRSCNSRCRECVRRFRARARSLRHGRGDFFAHRSMFFNQGWIKAKRVGFHLIRINNKSARKNFRRSGNIR